LIARKADGGELMEDERLGAVIYGAMSASWALGKKKSYQQWSGRCEKLQMVASAGPTPDIHGVQESVGRIYDRRERDDDDDDDDDQPSKKI
jgi:hypothetical protein